MHADLDLLCITVYCTADDLVARKILMDERCAGRSGLFDGEAPPAAAWIDLPSVAPPRLRGGVIARCDGRHRLADIAHLAGVFARGAAALR